MSVNSTEQASEGAVSELDSRYKNMDKSPLAQEAVPRCHASAHASSEFQESPALLAFARYWELYDGKTAKKLSPALQPCRSRYFPA